MILFNIIQKRLIFYSSQNISYCSHSSTDIFLNPENLLNHIWTTLPEQMALSIQYLAAAVLCSIVFDSLSNSIACQAPLLSMEFSRQEYLSGLPFTTTGDLTDPGVKVTALCLMHGRQILYHSPPGKASVSWDPLKFQSRGMEAWKPVLTWMCWFESLQTPLSLNTWIHVSLQN